VRAARFEGGGVVSFEERPEPVAGPGEAVVEVEYCAFCGSDKRLLRHGSAFVPGHEVVGRVAAVGGGEAAVAVGEAVAVYAPLFCGSCRWCLSGATNRCAALAGVVGFQFDGGFAERLVVPARNLMVVPRDVPLARAVLVLDTLGTAANGIERARAAVDGNDGPVLVLGCGPLGLGAVAVARRWGMEVVAHDVSAARLDAAVGLGARRWEAPDVGAEGAAGPDCFGVVVEASGAPEARELAGRVVGQGGAVLMLSEGEHPWVLPPTLRWRRTEAAWVRSFYFPLEAAPRTWQLVRDVGGELEERLVSHERFADLPRVSADFLGGGSPKPVVGIGGR
jgi:threonine dehydrogenase-like Zn-dependent dehydrogenase